MKLDGEGIVPNRVNIVETRPVRTAPSPAVGRKSQESPAPHGSKGDSGTDVQITGTARDLASIEQQLRDLPAVDERRVAAVRQRLDDGSYRIDAERIARGLMAMEQDIARAHPVDDAALK